MRVLVAVIFAVAGIFLVLPALGSLVEARYVTHQIFAMMQIIAGLLCFLIAVVAGLMRPSARTPAEGPRPPAAAAAAPAPTRDPPGMGFLIVLLALGLIALALRLRTPDHERDARTGIGAPPPSAPVSGRPMAPALSPSAKPEARKPGAKAHAPPKRKSAGD